MSIMLCWLTGTVSDPAHRVSELLLSGTLEALQRAQAASGRTDIRLGCYICHFRRPEFSLHLLGCRVTHSGVTVFCQSKPLL